MRIDQLLGLTHLSIIAMVDGIEKSGATLSEREKAVVSEAIEHGHKIADYFDGQKEVTVASYLPTGEGDPPKRSGRGFLRFIKIVLEYCFIIGMGWLIWHYKIRG